jgi:LysR family transcriptional regulator, benzoate and cis,cis-muconate-responsive activator of ben and cat genes
MDGGHRCAHSEPVPPEPPPWPSTLELEDLRTWIVLADEGDLRRAVDRLGITTKALTRGVQRLEDQLALTLLHTHCPDVVLTDAGQALTGHARTLIAGLDTAIAETRRTSGLGATLRFGCAPDVPLQRLQAFLGLLHASDPELRAEVTYERGARQAGRLAGGELDLGLIHDTGGDGDLATEPLFTGEPLMVFLPVSDPRAAKPALSPEDLAQDVLLMFPSAADPTLAAHLIDVITAAGFRFHDVRESRGADVRDVLLAAASHACVTLGPRSMTGVAGDAGTLVTAHRLEPPVWMPDTMLAWRPDPSPELGRMIAVAREVAAGLHRFSAENREQS